MPRGPAQGLTGSIDESTNPVIAFRRTGPPPQKHGSERLKRTLPCPRSSFYLRTPGLLVSRRASREKKQDTERRHELSLGGGGPCCLALPSRKIAHPTSVHLFSFPPTIDPTDERHRFMVNLNTVVTIITRYGPPPLRCLEDLRSRNGHPLPFASDDVVNGLIEKQKRKNKLYFPTMIVPLNLALQW